MAPREEKHVSVDIEPRAHYPGHMVNAIIKGSFCTGAPDIILLSQNLKAVWESLLNLLSELPLKGLTDANKNIKLIEKS